MNQNFSFGTPVKQHGVPTKRYCQTLDLRNDPQLIAAYRQLHSRKGIWPEILAGIKQAGVLEMEIYLLGSRLFMICELPVDSSWDEVMARMSSYPRQAEWEAHVARYQIADPAAGSTEKWKAMERIFHLYD